MELSVEPDRCTHEFLPTSTQSGMRWVNPLEVPEWDDLVRTHPEATVFHSRGWARVLAETYGYVPQYLVAADGQRLWAALPIFWVRSWLSGSRGVSLPFTDRCSPLLSQAFPLERLFKEAVRSGSAQHFASLEIRGVPADFAPVSGSFYEHELDLARSESVLFGGCDPAMRRSIRNAEKANLRIEERSDAEGLEGLSLLTHAKKLGCAEAFPFTNIILLIARYGPFRGTEHLSAHSWSKQCSKSGSNSPKFPHFAEGS